MSLCGDVVKECPACLSKTFMLAECRVGCSNCHGVYTCQGCEKDFHICQYGLEQYFCTNAGGHYRCWKDTKIVEVKGEVKLESKPEVKPEIKVETAKPKAEPEPKVETPLERYLKIEAEETELLCAFNPGDVCVRCGQVHWEPSNSFEVPIRKCQFCSLEWHICPKKDGVIVAARCDLECEFCQADPAGTPVINHQTLAGRFDDVIKQVKELPEHLISGQACPQCWNQNWRELVIEYGIRIRICNCCERSWHACPTARGVIVNSTAVGENVSCAICKRAAIDAEEAKKKAVEEAEKVAEEAKKDDGWVTCPKCRKRDRVCPCTCEYDCDHYECERCEVTWHDCPNDEGIFIMSNEAGHLYCYNCKSEKWMSRLRLNLVKEEKVRRESYNLAVKKAAADAKKSNKSNKP